MLSMGGFICVRVGKEKAQEEPGRRDGAEQAYDDTDEKREREALNEA